MANSFVGAVDAAGGALPPTAAARRTEDMSKQFLTLLVAQMQNQMPLKPMDSSQVTSQIAQINMVSGINDLNDTLTSITDQIDTTQRLQAAALIGRGVLVPGAGISVGEDSDGQGVVATPFGMDLAGPATQVTLTITDPIGTEVHKSTYSNLPAGVESYTWNGTDASGNPVGPGSYTVSIRAVAADGSPVEVQPLTMGYVSGVVAGDDGPKLDLGPKGMAALADVRQII